MTDSEKVSDARAKQILQRAAEIDRDEMSVETLRAAAREAGITEAAFEAALTEEQQEQKAPATVSRRRVLLGAGAVVLALLWVFLRRVVVEAPSAPPPPPEPPRDTPLTRASP
jgi:hypothetical protein